MTSLFVVSTFFRLTGQVRTPLRADVHLFISSLTSS